MKNHQGTARRLRLLLVGFVAVLGCGHKTKDQWDKEYFDKQVAEIQSGKSDYLHLYDVHGADKLLHSVAGLRGVKNLTIEQRTGVTDAGIAEIATLPDLTSLTFYQVQISDAWLELVKSCPRLEELNLTPRQPAFSITSVLAFPRLRKLYLDADECGDECGVWLDSSLMQLEHATSLEELTLLGGQFVKRKDVVISLQSKLPNCRITLRRNRNPHVQSIPLTDAD